MDTNSNIPAQKKVVSVEILHLDELGYGPKGEQTRRQWREECLENLLLGRNGFESWQLSVREQSKGYYERASFEYSFTDKNLKPVPAELEISSNCTLDYVGCSFDDTPNIFDSEFHLGVNFSAAIFTETVWFEKSIFHEFCIFNNVQFCGSAWFANANFESIGYFNNVCFKKYTNFNQAKFNEIVSFTNVEFIGNVNFSEASFNKNAGFAFSTFHDTAFFSKAIFSGFANFPECIFKGSTHFIQTRFEDECRFNGLENHTIFEGISLFENASFDAVGHFEKVKFKNRIPGFRGCKIDSTRLEFSENSEFPENDFEDGAIENASFLKRLADEHGQTDQALRFNAIELRLKRKSLKADFGFKAVTWLYEKLSNYGQSFVKPLFWYGALICLSALFAMIYSTYSDSPPAEQQVLCKPLKDQPPPLKLPYGRAVVEYAMFRAGGLMDFTDTGKQNNAVNCRLFEEPIEPPLMRAWGIFKGIASIALLFLAALGLRNKYRIK